ncbi:lipoyl(octanoyl) transferase LipB [Agitococcus lubricus]|uniref:Octanoyltransferase n=1 Tax=Agitococcus lubricus TaxID=1077255 RepID=A0A2T5IVL1_9GAMM|nr:lipoyl(octanoyl) transferase LipB [Agitococcus lubricus]PTQ87933.1 lipoyl(octanoyl) transferase [Agitococcus lubricus]
MLIIRDLGQVDFVDTWQKMRAFTDSRDADTPDELWLLQHPAVFTLGQAGKHEHILNQTAIPIVQTDRGGQVTYHGLGQLVGYCLFDVKRLQLGVRELVEGLEDCLVNILLTLNIPAYANRQAHGVYVEGKKIASLGLRIRKGCSYHGFALNVDMDLTPFLSINPCGYQGLEMTQVNALCTRPYSLSELGHLVTEQIQKRFYP